jgi:hypothetical protein
MLTVKRYEAGEIKCDDGGDSLLISCPESPDHTIISLVFDRKKASRAKVRELEHLIESMGLQAVELHSGGW